MTVATVSGIPLWVFPLFAFGVYSGLKALRTRTIRLAELAILPLVFLGLSVPSLVDLVPRAPLVPVLFVLAAWAGGTLGWVFLTKDPVSAHKDKMSLVIPGSAVSLVLFVGIFVVKFAYNYTVAVAPVAAAEPMFLSAVFGLSGLSTGIVFGRGGRLVREYLALTV
jgi:hypothetical protein